MKLKVLDLFSGIGGFSLGQEMHDRFVANDVTPPLTRGDLAWADMVQFVMRRAGDLVGEREG